MLAEPKVHLWTCEEYYKMAEAGLFEAKNVELIEGQIIEMSPMGSLHATAVTLIARVLERVFGEGYFVRWQMPFRIGELSEPEPDIAVIAGDVRDYKSAHPSTAVLIVEVAETSLEYDRTTKANVYAKAGISDYWIANLTRNQLELYRNPAQESAGSQNYSYTSRTVLTPTDFVKPLVLPEVEIAVAELLP